MAGAGRDRGDAAVDVPLGGVPAADADPHRRAAVPDGRPAPAGSLLLDGGDDGAGPRLVTEVHDDLVEHDVVGHGVAGAAHSVGEPPRQRAGPVHQGGHAVAAEGGEHRPHLRATCPLGRLRRDVHGLQRGVLGKVGGRRLHRRTQRPRIGDQRDPAVVGRVQPLVRVGRPRIGTGDARDLIGGAGRGRRPQPERPVHVHPGAVVVGPVDQRTERIAGPGVDVACLQADKCRPGKRGQAARLDPALAVGGQQQGPVPA